MSEESGYKVDVFTNMRFMMQLIQTNGYIPGNFLDLSTAKH